MKKILSFWLSCAATCLASLVSYGQTDPHTEGHLSDTLAIDEAVITGLTGPTRLRESPVPFSYISGKSLHSQASTNIVSAIARYPGISQISTGPGISKPVVRGLGYNRVVVVNDGIRQEGQQWGDEHGLELDGNSVGSVEILKGPASIMYGSDALAGVVIFKSAPELAPGTILSELTTEYQSASGLAGYSLSFEGNKGGAVWSGRLSDRGAHSYANPVDGFVPNSQFRERAASLMGGIHRRWGSSHVRLTYFHQTPSMPEMEEDIEADRWSYSHGVPFQEIHHYRAILDDHFYLGEGSLTFHLAYQQNRRQEFEEEDEAELDMKLSSVSWDLRYNLPQKTSLKIVAGAAGMFQWSKNIGEEALIPDYGMTDAGAYITASEDVGKWNLSGGLRYDHRSLYSKAMEDRFSELEKSFNAVTGSLGAVWHPAEGLDVRLNIARGYRSPSINELCSNGEHEGTFRYEVGTSSLKPEYSLQGDFGIEYTAGWLSLGFSPFASRIDNYIYISPRGDISDEGVPVYMFVQGDARLLGGEATIDVHPLKALHLGNSFSMVDSRKVGKKGDERRLPFTPAPRWTSEIMYEFGEVGRALRNAEALLRMECYLAQNHIADGEFKTPSYTVFSITAGTDIIIKGKKRASVSIFAENLFNRAYQNHLSRLRYAGFNEMTGRNGFFDPGRNIGIKMVIPLVNVSD